MITVKVALVLDFHSCVVVGGTDVGLKRGMRGWTKERRIPIHDPVSDEWLGEVDWHGASGFEVGGEVHERIAVVHFTGIQHGRPLGSLIHKGTEIVFE